MSTIKVLISCIHYPVASGRYIAAALWRLGHEVKTVGPTTGNEIWGMKVNDKFEWMPDILINPVPDVAVPVESVLEALGDWQPDLIITADSAWALSGKPPMPNVVWGVDNHVRDYRAADWDHLFLAHSWGFRMDGPNAHWLPCAYDPKVCFNAHTRRDADVVFIGVLYPQRREYARAFAQSGLSVFFNTGPIYAEYNCWYNRARIAFVNSARGDLAIRFFENMAQGCCVLADRTMDADKLGFKPCVDYWTYEGIDDAVTQAKFLIESGLWQHIAANGQEQVKEHTWDNRAAQLLREIGMSQ